MTFADEFRKANQSIIDPALFARVLHIHLQEIGVARRSSSHNCERDAREREATDVPAFDSKGSLVRFRGDS
jgi:hypothetical protein